MGSFIVDAFTLSSSIVKALVLALLTVLSLAVLGVTFLALALVSPTVVPLGILFLVTYAIYQAVHSSPAHSYDHEYTYHSYRYLPVQPSADEQLLALSFEVDFAVYGTDCLNHEPVTEQDTTPVCSITYSLLATTGTMDTDYLSTPVIANTANLYNAPLSTSDATAMMDNAVVDSLAVMDRTALVAYARSLGIKGISARWTDETIKRKVMERTLYRKVA